MERPRILFCPGIGNEPTKLRWLKIEWIKPYLVVCLCWHRYDK